MGGGEREELHELAASVPEPSSAPQPDRAELKRQGDRVLSALSQEDREWAAKIAPTPQSGKPLHKRMAEAGIPQSENVEDRRPPAPASLGIVPFETFEVDRPQLESQRFARWCQPLYERTRRPPHTAEEASQLRGILITVNDAYVRLPALARFQLHVWHPLLSAFSRVGDVGR